MVIEWLKFQVDRAERDRFIAVDRAIWTTALAQYPGFIRKQVWWDMAIPEQVICVIEWQSVMDWQAIPATDLARLEQQFASRLGPVYKLLEARSYHLFAEVVGGQAPGVETLGDKAPEAEAVVDSSPSP